ncbi:MAG: EamA family transporter [Bacteroidota bacterium]
MKNLLSDRILIPAAFGVIYIVWGSTYLANWYAIRDIPTFLMCGCRFFIAGILLFLVSLFFGAKRPKLEHWKSTALMGFFFFFIGNGGAVWALNYLDSGIAALIIACQPLVTVLMMWAMLSKRPSKRTLFGVGIGFLGMVLLVTQDQFTSSEEMLVGVAVIIICVIGWGFASVKISRIPLPDSKIQAAAMQMMIGGSMLLVFSFGTGDAFQFDLANLTPRGTWSFVYLTFFGAFIAFSAFNYLLLKVSPDKVATATYVNPVVALLLGWGINNEVITMQSLLAGMLLLSGVVFINTKKGFLRRKKIENTVVTDMIQQRDAETQSR